jgi:hypothetical protein
MTNPSSAPGWRQLTGHVAFKALFKSVLINMAAPSLLYRLAAPHFDAHSLIPLAVSGLPPIVWLTYSVVRLKAVDFLGLFAAENVVVSMAALVLSHSEQQALVGRSLQNVVLAAIFAASIAIGKPLVLYMARQLSTGNDPGQASRFEDEAMKPRVIQAYRDLTWFWTLALLIKAAGSYYLASQATTKQFLVFSPLWDLISDTVLVSWSILYGRARLSRAVGVEPPPVALATAGSEP